MKQSREQELLTRLSMVEKLSLSDVMDLLGISESTARRMFARLEQDGLLIRTHGGVQSVNYAMTRYSFEHGTRTNIDKKIAIARKSCSFLENGDVVYCDSGMALQCFCAEMCYRLRKEKLNISVYTNSIANLELLSPYLTVNLLGGAYRTNRKDFCGYLTEKALKDLYFTKSFLGADGCRQGRQFTTTDFETARMNEIVMRNSDRTFMLVDSSKFSMSSHVAYAPVQNIYATVTDTGIDPATLTQLEYSGAKIILADAEEGGAAR